MNQVPLNPFPISPPTGGQAQTNADPAPPAKRRKGRPRKSVADPVKPTRRKRQARAVPATKAPRGVQISIGILPALTGLKEEDTSVLMSIIGNLQDVPKASRARIVAALGRIFA